MKRLTEIVDDCSVVYPAASLNWRQLESSNYVEFTPDMRFATWFISDLKDCDRCRRRIKEFSEVKGFADFALVGGQVFKLPETMHVTTVEKHGDVVLTVGKRIKL